MKATIENLRNGKCTVRNDGTLEELNVVLKAAFPKCTASSGLYNYYKSDRGKGWNAFDYCSSIQSYSVKTFIKNMKQEITIMKNRTLRPRDAQNIIDIACKNVWKPKLAKLWATDIVMGNDIIITESFYKEMRSACTETQHKLFDKIFGMDVLQYKVGDWVTRIKENGGVHSLGKTFLISGIDGDQVIESGTENKHFKESIRLATPEEIKKATWYPHLTPCLVEDNQNGWLLRYSAKNYNSFYVGGMKVGSTMEWKKHRKLDINNLP